MSGFTNISEVVTDSKKNNYQGHEFSNIPVGGFFIPEYEHTKGLPGEPNFFNSDVHIKTGEKSGFNLHESDGSIFKDNEKVIHVYSLEIERTYED